MGIVEEIELGRFLMKKRVFLGFLFFIGFWWLVWRSGEKYGAGPGLNGLS